MVYFALQIPELRGSLVLPSPQPCVALTVGISCQRPMEFQSDVFLYRTRPRYGSSQPGTPRTTQLQLSEFDHHDLVILPFWRRYHPSLLLHRPWPDDSLCSSYFSLTSMIWSGILTNSGYNQRIDLISPYGISLFNRSIPKRISLFGAHPWNEHERSSSAYGNWRVTVSRESVTHYGALRTRPPPFPAVPRIKSFRTGRRLLTYLPIARQVNPTTLQPFPRAHRKRVREEV